MIRWSGRRPCRSMADGWLIESVERFGDRRAQIFSPSRLYPSFTLFFPGEAGEDFDTLDAAQRRAEELVKPRED